MKQRIYVAILTALIFGVGYVAGLYTERHRPLPGPPVQFLGEFAPPKAPADAAAQRGGPKPINRAEILGMVRSLLPQLQAFQQRSEEIDAQFEHDLDPILTPEQRVKHADEIKKHLEHLQRDENRPLTDGVMAYLIREVPSHTISMYVVIGLPLDEQTKRYNLDPAQREQVRALLRQRRDRYLALVDSSPPPSVMLSRLAPLVQRLAEPAPGAAAPAAPAPPASPAK